MECSERVRSADVHEALIAFFKKRPPDLQHRRGYSQGSSSLKELRASAMELTCLVKQPEPQSQVGAEANKMPGSVCPIQPLLQEHVIVSLVRGC
jgi:hypothetical protein